MNMISTCVNGHRYHIGDNECPHCTPYIIQSLATAYSTLRRVQREIARLEAEAKAEGIDLEQWKERLHP